MKNIMEINGYWAVVNYDPEIAMYRGEFAGLNGGADFYAADVDGLKREGALSLKVFLDMCREDGVAPTKPFSGDFHVRMPPNLHAAVAAAAAAEGKSLNRWINDELRTSLSMQ